MPDDPFLEDVHRRLKFTQFTVDQAKVAVFWCHADGFFFYVNDTACEWLQYRRDELMEMHVADINPEFPREGWDAHWAEIREKGLVRMESFHRRKNGEVYPVEIYSNYVEFGGKHYKLAFVHDISARRRAEEEKAALEDRLRQTQKLEAIGGLAGGVAHDLNNLLLPVIGYTEVLLEDVDERDSRWDCLKEIRAAGMRARDVVRQLLAFSRRQPLEMRPLNLTEVVRGFEKMIRHTIREDVRIEMNLAKELAAVEGDAGQIEQIILNLTVNAQDAMPAGGTLTIETREVELDDSLDPEHEATVTCPHVMMVVTDTGEGMDEETRQRIFEPFFSTKLDAMGTGLGLATVYGIVKQHRGSIWVHSEPGHGTTFQVLFPTTDRTAESASPPGEQTVGTVEGSETILVVEDQEQVLDLTCRILTRHGYAILRASSVEEALQHAATHPGGIDLLLTDVVMPNMNGKELYQRLVADGRSELAVLYTSGYTNDVVMRHGIAEEGVHLLPKPFSVQGLALKVREVLNSRQ